MVGGGGEGGGGTNGQEHTTAAHARQRSKIRAVASTREQQGQT